MDLDQRENVKIIAYHGGFVVCLKNAIGHEKRVTCPDGFKLEDRRGGLKKNQIHLLAQAWNKRRRQTVAQFQIKTGPPVALLERRRILQNNPYIDIAKPIGPPKRLGPIQIDYRHPKLL